MKLRFACPTCNRPERLRLPAGAGELWQCPACDHRVELQAAVTDTVPNLCALCGNPELYRQKNFPHWLGLTILTVACAGFLFFMYQHEPYWAWAVLLGSAAFDGLLYACVGDAVVCYRCGAHYTSVTPRDEHRPHDLTTSERYRQERLRREEMKQ